MAWYIGCCRLRAFKSVGDGWLEVRFELGLNAIVGPNGCGKSSLLDAMAFAFGASPKALGVPSLSDLRNDACSELCEVQVQLKAGSPASKGRERGAGSKSGAPGRQPGSSATAAAAGEAAARAGAAHWVSATLGPDGRRAFRVDGRVRTGREVREMLRGLGVRLDGAGAVIRQARVTHLADANDPTELAAVVAEASGLGRWNEEVTAATTELQRTRKALAEVQAHLGTLERRMAQDREQHQQLERLSQLESEAAALARQVGANLQAALACCGAEAQRAEQEVGAARGRVEAGREEEGRCLAEVESATALLREAHQQQQQQQEGEEEGEEEEEGAAAGGGSHGSRAGWCGRLLRQQQRVAAGEEEVSLLQGRLQAHRQLLAEREQQQAAAQQAGAEAARCAAQLGATQQAQQRVQADQQRVHSAQAVHALRASLEAELVQLQRAAAAEEQAVQCASRGVVQSQQRLDALLTEHLGICNAATAAAAAAAAGQAAGSAGQQQQQRERLASLQVGLVQQESAAQRLWQQEQQLSAQVGLASARLASSTRCGADHSAAPNCRPLHACFRFADPAASQHLAEPLALLAGKRLGVVVAPTSAAAAALLGAAAAGSSGLRLWPLDALLAPDHLQRHRTAAQHFPPGDVVVPADLLRYEAALRPAILRAFGTHVIARSDSVAEALIRKYGIPSVTLDGKVTSQGTLQGGWRGAATTGAQAQGSPMHAKLALDAAQQAQQALQQQAGATDAAAEACRGQLSQLQAQQEEAERAAAEAAACEVEVHACRLQLGAAQAALAAARAGWEATLAEVAAKRQLLASLGGGADGGGVHASSAEGAAAALGREEVRLGEAACQLAVQLAAAQSAQAAAEERAAQLEESAALAEPEVWAERLAAALQGLAETRESLAQAQAQAALQLADIAAAQEELQQARVRLGAAQQAIVLAEGDLEEAEGAEERLREAAAELQQQQLGALLAETPELQTVLDSAGGYDGDGGDARGDTSGGGGGSNSCEDDDPSSADRGGRSGSGGSATSLAKARAALVRRRAAVLKEAAALSSAACDIPLAEQLAVRERSAALAAVTQQAATLRLACARLQEGMDGSNSQVLRVNEAVYQRIEAAFSSLAEAVLPAYCLRLARLGASVHEGVQLQYRHRGSSTANGTTDGTARDAAGRVGSSREVGQQAPERREGSWPEGGGEEEGQQGGPACTRDDSGSRGNGGDSGGGWRSGLGALSGGQRTMVSLAFVLAAAMVGGSSGVLLMDEVDAALDETNQHLLASLFGSLTTTTASSSSSAFGGTGRGAKCSQVLCVSHNVAFQQLCGGVVQLCRSAGGHTALAAAAGAALHPGGGAAAKKGRRV